MNWEYIKGLITRTFKEWLADNGKTDSAALAYYFVLSLPSLLLFSMSIGSIFLRSKDLQDIILGYLNGVVDERVIGMLVLLFERIPETGSLSISAVAAFVLLLWSASNVFRQLKSFLEKIWDVRPGERGKIESFIRNAFVSSVAVIIFGGLLVISILVEGALFKGSRILHDLLPFSPGIAPYAGSMASFLILVLFFMFLYRVLPDTNLDFRSIFAGSLVTVILITIGKYAVGLYLAYSGLRTVYGVIGSIIGLFLWFYYSSIMITIGAEFTKVYSES